MTTAEAAPGIDRSRCSAKHHGTASRYTAFGCRCPDALKAHRQYQKLREAGKQPPLWIDSTGSARRLQALAAAGYPFTMLTEPLGMCHDQVSRVARQTNPQIRVASAQRIREVTSALWQTPGPSRRLRVMARNKGWVPFAAWNDIDDPSETPNLSGPAWKGPDESVVIELMAGRPVKSRLADRKEAARRMLLRGDNMKTISDRLGTRWRMLRAIQAELDAESEVCDAAA